jgi:hypothetical protein
MTENGKSTKEIIFAILHILLIGTALIFFALGYYLIPTIAIITEIVIWYCTVGSIVDYFTKTKNKNT